MNITYIFTFDNCNTVDDELNLESVIEDIFLDLDLDFDTCNNGFSVDFIVWHISDLNRKKVESYFVSKKLDFQSLF